LAQLYAYFSTLSKFSGFDIENQLIFAELEMLGTSFPFYVPLILSFLAAAKPIFFDLSQTHSIYFKL